MKRLTHREVEAVFKAEGYQLLDSYTEAHAKMRYTCPKGHEHQSSWTNFNSGHRCPYCSGSIVTHEMVLKAFTDNGYQLLDRYTNKSRKLRYICPQGHHHAISWSNFKTGHRCAYCSGSILTHEQVQSAFEQAGYQLLDRYRNNSTKMRFICSVGHHHSMSWAAFHSGDRCAKCAGRHVPHEEVEAAFSAEGYQLLSKFHKTEKRLEFICPNGHQHSISWAAFKLGHRCALCARNAPITQEQVELAFALEGYQLLDRYINTRTRMRFICPEGHNHATSWDVWKQGGRCARCKGFHKTKEELEIESIKKKILNLVQHHIRTQKVKKGYSISPIAQKAASEVFRMLGIRPDGHHLDHIIPQSFFDFRNQHEAEACWAIENLRYLPARENESRQNRLTLEEIQQMTPEQLKILKLASRKPKKIQRMLDLHLKGYSQLTLL